MRRHEATDLDFSPVSGDNFRVTHEALLAQQYIISQLMRIIGETLLPMCLVSMSLGDIVSVITCNMLQILSRYVRFYYTVVHLCSHGPGHCRSNQVCSPGTVVPSCRGGSASTLPSDCRRRCGRPSLCCRCRDTPHSGRLVMPSRRRIQGGTCRSAHLRQQHPH